MLAQYHKLSRDQKALIADLGPFTFVCADPEARKRKAAVKNVYEAQSQLKTGSDSNLIDLQKEPFRGRLRSVEDWTLYGMSDLFFQVNKVSESGRWRQTIRHTDFSQIKNHFWVTEDIDTAADISRRIAACPNCVTNGLPWPEAAVAVPVNEVARHFLALGWEKSIVDEVILWHKTGKK